MAKPKPNRTPNLDLGVQSKRPGSTALQLIGGGNSDGKNLTKEQKRFNLLVRKIKGIRARIVSFAEADQELRTLGQKMIIPAEEKFMHALRKLVLAMHKPPYEKKLTKRLRVKFHEVMRYEIASLLNSAYFSDDAELRTLFGHYSAISYEEMQEETAKAEKEAAADMFGFFGLDLDPEDLNDPTKLKEKLDAQMGGMREQEDTRKGAGKKTKTQVDAESKRQAAEDAVKKTTRQIYLDLVKHCHPDREQDELKRAEKTEWMKKITAAYEVNDHLLLLELQMTLLTERENAFADFNNNELKYFNESLQQQLSQLETELMMANPMYSGNMFGNLFHPNRSTMLRGMQREQDILDQRTCDVINDAQLITSEQGFKRYIADYQLPMQHGSELDEDFW